MLRLAVATQAETFDRLRDPLAQRDIEVVGLSSSKATFDLSGDPLPAVDVGYVFPPRLMEGGFASAALDIPWVNDRGALLRSRNKAETLCRLSKAGIPVPETMIVSNPVNRDKLIEVFESFDSPVVLKPNSTSRGTGVTLAHDLDSFLGIADYLDLVHDYRATGDRSFLVQEYLSGARDYRAMVIDGTYVGAVERRLSRTQRQQGHWKHNVHRGGDPTSVELDPELKRLAEETAETLDIPVVGVDILQTNDRVVVSETNARPTIDASEKYVTDFWKRLTTIIRQTANNRS